MTTRPSQLGCALMALGLGVAAGGCNTSSGGLITHLPVYVGGAVRDAGGPLVFTSRYFAPQGCGSSAAGFACGWQVELDQAAMSVGPFYFNTQPPGTQGIQVGTVIVQVTSQSYVDVLDPTLYPVDGGGSGETGPAASVEVDLFPPGCNGSGAGIDVCTSSVPPPAYTGLIPGYATFLNDPSDPALIGFAEIASKSSAFVAGTATEILIALADGGAVTSLTPLLGRDFQSAGDLLDAGVVVDAGLVAVPFIGFITIDASTGGNPNDPAASYLTELQQVAGACPCPSGCSGNGGCSLTFPVESSALQIRVDPSPWFDGVDFATLIPPPPSTWTPDAGPLTWNTSGGNHVLRSIEAFSADNSFNTQLVESGILSSNGVYLFNIVLEGNRQPP